MLCFKICIRGVGFILRVGFYALRKLGFLTILKIQVYKNTVVLSCLFLRWVNVMTIKIYKLTKAFE